MAPADWIKIYTNPDGIRASMVMTLLEANQIEVVKFNRMDSSYVRFGEVELYIHAENFDTALELIIAAEL